jgi:hypothetical protein
MARHDGLLLGRDTVLVYRLWRAFVFNWFRSRRVQYVLHPLTQNTRWSDVRGGTRES